MNTDTGMEITRYHTALWLKHNCGRFACGAKYEDGKLYQWRATTTVDGEPVLDNLECCPSCGKRFPTGISVKVAHLTNGSGLTPENWSEIEEQLGTQANG